MLHLLLAPLAALVAANGVPQNNHHHHQHPQDDEWEGGIQQNVRIYPDAGVWPFQFGPAGTLARQAFQINTYTTLVLYPFDCYCGGDAFIVYDNGQEIARVNADCQVADSTCQSYSNNPYECLHNNTPNQSWCGANMGFIPIFPGRHNFTILSTASPYNSGIGFLQLNLGCFGGGSETDDDDSWWPCCFDWDQGVKLDLEEVNDECDYSIQTYKACRAHE